MEKEKKKDTIICKLRILRHLYNVSGNDFKILSVEPLEVMEGEDLIVLNDYGNFTIKGNAPSQTSPSETYMATLSYEGIDDKFGSQYNIIHIHQDIDLTDKNIQRMFLESFLTERQINSLYETLDEPFEAIVNGEIESLIKCHGIGVKVAQSILNRYENTKDFSAYFVKFYEAGLTNALIRKLVEHYKSPDLILEKIKANPYQLTAVDGIGFRIADTIALENGWEEYSLERFMAFINYYLEEVANTGHSWVAPNDIFYGLRTTLNLDANRDDYKRLVKDSMNTLLERAEIVSNKDKSKIASKKVFVTEYEIAKHIKRIQETAIEFKKDDYNIILRNLQDSQGWDYTKEQYEGIETVLDSPITVVHGGGGVGKTTIVSGMLEVLTRYGYTFKQGALSGKASSRMAETNGEESYTFHRMLGYNPREGGFMHNEENPLPDNVYIFDEFSMVGADITLDLLKAIPDGSKVIIICDTGQLEAIGMGNVAHDLIESEQVTIVHLKEIHRQAQKSAIITNSMKVRFSEQIANSTGHAILGELQDLEMDLYNEKEESVDKIVKYFKQELAKVDTIMDLQVVVPNRQKADLSSNKLNPILQDIANPIHKGVGIGIKSTDFITVGSKKYNYDLRIGDKVINVKNTYEGVFSLEGELEPIYNGDTGLLREIDRENKCLIIEFIRTGKLVVSFDFLQNIQLAYALSTHKMQGAETKRVIVGIDYGNYVMLCREAIYTAITRASEYCVLVAQFSALKYAINKSNVTKKQTFLQGFLTGSMKLEDFGLDENYKKEKIDFS